MPSSWTKKIHMHLAGSVVDTGDAGFDREWWVVSDNAGAARHLLDEETRDAFRELGCWCRVTYTDGAIEVHRGIFGPQRVHHIVRKRRSTAARTGPSVICSRASLRSSRFRNASCMSRHSTPSRSDHA